MFSQVIINYYNIIIFVVQSFQLCLTLCDLMDCSPSGFPVLHSVQFSCSVVSSSLQPHRLQHTRLPCPSPTPGACSNSCPLSQWCRPTISSSIVPFFSCFRSFPASGSYSNESVLCIRWPNIGASASVLPMKVQGRFLLGLTGSPCSSRDSQDDSSFSTQFESINLELSLL